MIFNRVRGQQDLRGRRRGQGPDLVTDIPQVTIVPIGIAGNEEARPALARWSSTPCSPKSGKHDDLMAPIECAAGMQPMASAMFGIIVAKDKRISGPCVANRFPPKLRLASGTGTLSSLKAANSPLSPRSWEESQAADQNVPRLSTEH